MFKKRKPETSMPVAEPEQVTFDSPAQYFESEQQRRDSARQMAQVEMDAEQRAHDKRRYVSSFALCIDAEGIEWRAGKTRLETSGFRMIDGFIDQKLRFTIGTTTTWAQIAIWDKKNGLTSPMKTGGFDDAQSLMDAATERIHSEREFEGA